tara:strand:- start:307 stop:603 length:297 start_codon:yes stop_codon:yes gene_type:complete
MAKEPNKLKIYWDNLTAIQKLIVLIFVLIFGSIFIPKNKTPQIQKVPVFVPVPSQQRFSDPAIQRSIQRRNQILNPSGVRCFNDLDQYGRPSINCQKY